MTRLVLPHLTSVQSKPTVIIDGVDHTPKKSFRMGLAENKMEGEVQIDGGPVIVFDAILEIEYHENSINTPLQHLKKIHISKKLSFFDNGEKVKYNTTT